MQFAVEEYLNWLWLTLLIWLCLRWFCRRRQKRLNRFAESQLIDQIVMHFSHQRIMLRNILLACIFFFCLLALARPQWGFEWQAIRREGVDIMIAIDTSKSMLTQDVSPNRLMRAKLAVRDLLQRLRGDRVGIIAFAGDAFLMCPLTSDYAGVRLTLDDLDVTSIPHGGTNIGTAIEVAMQEYQSVPAKYKAIIILTDGENLEGDALAKARQARQAGIKVYCVGIGTQEGELIQQTNVFGEKEFIKDEKGHFVKSRLNEELLQEIALTTGGIYVRASGVRFGLDIIYENELSRFEKRETERKMEKRYHERFQWPLTVAVLLLILETGLSTYHTYQSKGT